MSNTFKNTDLVVRDASCILGDNLVFANLSNRNHEQKFGLKVGSTIEIKVPPVQTARDFIDDSSTVTDNAITESDVDLTLTEEPYVAHTLTTSEKTLDLDDFSVVVTAPAALAVRDAIDTFVGKAAVRGFARNNAGTEGTNPSTLAHLVAGRKILQDLGCPSAGRVGVLNTTAEASILQLSQVTSADYGAERPMGLRDAQMGRIYGIDWFADQNVTSHSRGTGVAVLVDVYGGSQTGTSLIVDDSGVGTSTTTILAGTRFTVAGLSNTYTVIADATAVAGIATLQLDQALESSPADNATITYKTAATGNVVYKRDALGVAIVPPAALAIGSSVAYMDGTGMRVTMSTSTTSLSDQIVYDTLCGAIVIQPSGGAVLCG